MYIIEVAVTTHHYWLVAGSTILKHVPNLSTYPSICLRKTSSPFHVSVFRFQIDVRASAGQRQNRESHINICLTGRGLYLHAEEPCRLYADQHQTHLIEKITASEDESVPLRSFDQKSDIVNEARQSLSISNIALMGGVGSSYIT